MGERDSDTAARAVEWTLQGRVVNPVSAARVAKADELQQGKVMRIYTLFGLPFSPPVLAGMRRLDPQDAGPGYRNVVGLPGGTSSPLFKVLQEANKNKMELRAGQVGQEPGPLEIGGGGRLRKDARANVRRGVVGGEQELQGGQAR